MLFYSFFKSLVGKDVVVELKNDLSICGTLHSVDQVGCVKYFLKVLPYSWLSETSQVLRIRADKSLSVPEHQTDWHKCDRSRQVSTYALSQELLHQGLRGQVDIFTPETLWNIMITSFFIPRYVQLPGDEVDTQLLQDATRKEAAQNKAWNPFGEIDSFEKRS